jgi:very-short-patch-repair endonuclease
VVGPRTLEAALATAERDRLSRRRDVLRLIARGPRRRGLHALRALLANSGAAALTRSEAEKRLLALVRRGGLPAPATNVLVEGQEVDFLWSEARLVVEVDGFAFHASRSAFESDRRRDARLAALGYRVVRTTWRQIVEEPEATLVGLARTLVAAGARWPDTPVT